MTRPIQRNHKSSSSPRVDASVRGVLGAMALAGLVLLFHLTEVWLGTISETTIPIGSVKSASAASSGMDSLTVIETDTGFYALLGPAIIDKGTSLVLDVRLNGDQYVCDASRRVCVRTSSRQLSTVRTQTQPR